ncbi:MAG: methyltransferase domain-containing protein [Chloroflexota bacterium]|nr:methyltransferase domain-containing protein [Chloroflexota bacterium]
MATESLTHDSPDGVTCPCCGGTFTHFLPHGVHPRPRARCPACGSLERHRLTALYLTHKTTLFHERLSVLDIAPHPSLLRLFSTLPHLDYLSADLHSPLAMVKTDICDMPFPTDSFDVIVCMHVLEHVPDDRQALRELYRVLKPGGWAIVQVPLVYKQRETLEDPRVTAPEDRERLFGQHDHVRRYGLDYEERLRDAGFAVELVSCPTELGPDAVARYGLKRNRDRYLWMCRM